MLRATYSEVIRTVAARQCCACPRPESTCLHAPAARAFSPLEQPSHPCAHDISLFLSLCCCSLAVHRHEWRQISLSLSLSSTRRRLTSSAPLVWTAGGAQPARATGERAQCKRQASRSIASRRPSPTACTSACPQPSPALSTSRPQGKVGQSQSACVPSAASGQQHSRVG